MSPVLHAVVAATDETDPHLYAATFDNQCKMIAKMLLHPKKMPVMFPDIVFSYAYEWVSTLDHEERIVYFHHLRGYIAKDTAILLSCTEERVVAILQRAISRAYLVLEKYMEQGKSLDDIRLHYVNFLREEHAGKPACHDYIVFCIMKELMQHFICPKI